ncbi:hypothetical protein ATANTOWER_015553 [Ataeniobius toweri]|uniref:Uncharacterized protein n=1 Tax=Ataeniobius toweri TaxID=208326 RepID=A0ABU7BTI2_9TELE|nr:hypothetical protein [Ataeniobius toweri]
MYKLKGMSDIFRFPIYPSSIHPCEGQLWALFTYGPYPWPLLWPIPPLKMPVLRPFPLLARFCTVFNWSVCSVKECFFSHVGEECITEVDNGTESTLNPSSPSTSEHSPLTPP